MSPDSKVISYRRERSLGMLKLGAGTGMSEAANLRSAALRALSDTKAAHVRADCSGAGNLDLSTVQILMALGKELTQAGRGFSVEGLDSATAERLERCGMSLQPVSSE